MRNRSNLINTLASFILAIFLMSSFSGCETIEGFWNDHKGNLWEGVFDLGEGWQVELEGEGATFVTSGTNKVGIAIGRSFAIGMVLTGKNKWRGYVPSNNGFGYLGWGNAEIVDNKLNITPDGASPYTLNKGVKSTGTGNSSPLSGIWVRIIGASRDETNIAIGGISGEPSNRVYMCELKGNVGLYKGYISGNTIKWDSQYRLPDASVRKVGSQLEFYYPSVSNSLPSNYNSGSWARGCGELKKP